MATLAADCCQITRRPRLDYPMNGVVVEPSGRKPISKAANETMSALLTYLKLSRWPCRGRGREPWPGVYVRFGRLAAWWAREWVSLSWVISRGPAVGAGKLAQGECMMEWTRKLVRMPTILVALVWLSPSFGNETFGCSPVSSLCRNLQITASVGQQVRVGGHVRFQRDCKHGPIPEMTIVVQPKLGTVSTNVETVTSTNPNFGTCPPGSVGPGKVVYYTATTSGRDNFHYRMSSPALPTTDWFVTANVR